jgi:hypothetical protein
MVAELFRHGVPLNSLTSLNNIARQRSKCGNFEIAKIVLREIP